MAKSNGAIAADILKRDAKDLKRGGDYLPYYDSYGDYKEERVGKAPTKMEAMEFLDAYRRRIKAGDNYLLPREIKELGEKGEAEARALRKPVKKAKGGIVKGNSTASKRADGCATKGKTKGRMV